MIEKEGKKLILECDLCGSYVDDFFDFQEIIDYKKNNGWKNYRVEKMWVDVCPNCVSKFNNQTRWKYGKKYPELHGKCLTCLGCNRLDLKDFKGVYRCDSYMEGENK